MEKQKSPVSLLIISGLWFFLIIACHDTKIDSNDPSDSRSLEDYEYLKNTKKEHILNAACAQRFDSWNPNGGINIGITTAFEGKNPPVRSDESRAKQEKMTVLSPLAAPAAYQNNTPKQGKKIDVRFKSTRPSFNFGAFYPGIYFVFVKDLSDPGKDLLVGKFSGDDLPTGNPITISDISADGQKIFYVNDGQKRYSVNLGLHIVNLNTPGEEKIWKPLQTIIAAAFAPGGERILAVIEDTAGAKSLVEYDLTSEQAKPVIPALEKIDYTVKDPDKAVFSHDRKYLAQFVADGKGLNLHLFDLTTKQKKTTFKLPVTGIPDKKIEWSPDDKNIGFSSSSANEGVYVLDVITGKAEQWVKGEPCNFKEAPPQEK